MRVSMEVMNPPYPPRLLFSVLPWSDESIVNSYQVRVREANRVGSLDQLAAVANRPQKSLSIFQLLTDVTALTCLGQMAGLDYDLATAAPTPLLGAAGHELRWNKGALSVQFWMHTRSQVCPSCLDLNEYLPDSLDYWHLPVCTDHHCLVVETCPECAEYISPNRPTLLFCGTCGFDLRECVRHSVSEELCDVASKLSGLAGIPLLTSRGSAFLNASQIAALCVYFSVGEAAPALAPKLSPATERVAAKVRLEALKTLSACMDG